VLVSNEQTLSFDYDPSPSDQVEVRVNEVVTGSLGWMLKRIDMSQGPPPVQVLRSPGGDTVELTPQPLTARDLGLAPIVFNPIETGIAQVTAAIARAANAATQLGAKQKEIEGATSFASLLQDKLTGSLGDLVDADLAKENRDLSALQTRQALTTQSLRIANANPQLLLRLFGPKG
jgi:hypothetical protein